MSATMSAVMGREMLGAKSYEAHEQALGEMSAEDAQSPSIMDRMRSSRFGRVLTSGAAALACAGVLEMSVGTDTAEAGTHTYKEGNAEITETADSTVSIGKSKMSAESATSANVVGNARTVSKVRIRRAMRQGKCDRMSGRKAMKLGLRTQGYGGTGKKYALENRRSTMCDLNGDGRYDVRAECGNRAKGGRPKPKQAKEVIWVKSYNKAKMNLTSNVTVSARSGCLVKRGNATAYAESAGSASASASASLKIKSAMKAHGRGITRVKTQQVAKLSGSLKTSATASAYTRCEANGGKVVPPKPKDGTQTPPPPANAPGPNPAPADTQSRPCYDEQTGQPVEPVNNNCPPGSYGQV